MKVYIFQSEKTRATLKKYEVDTPFFQDIIHMSNVTKAQYELIKNMAEQERLLFYAIFEYKTMPEVAAAYGISRYYIRILYQQLDSFLPRELATLDSWTEKQKRRKK